MSDEVRPEEEKSEVDFAMLYSEQLRITEEYRTRLLGLMYETLPYMNAAIGLMESILDVDAKRSNQYMHQLVNWRADMESAVYLNIFVPPTESGIATAKVPTKEGKLHLEDLTDMEALGDVLEPYGRKIADAWDKFAEETGVHSRQHAKRKYRKEAENKADKHNEGIERLRKQHGVADLKDLPDPKEIVEELVKLLETADNTVIDPKAKKPKPH